MPNFDLDTYCQTLINYRKEKNTDLLIHQKKTPQSDECQLELSENALTLTIHRKNKKSIQTLDLNTQTITVDQTQMPKDYADEWLKKIESIVKNMPKPFSQAFKKESQ